MALSPPVGYFILIEMQMTNTQKPKSTMKTFHYVLLIAISAMILSCKKEVEVAAPLTPVDPLPSWNDTPTKKAIIDFVTVITTDGNPKFVPAEERIATFDNDGTLWCEQPLYFEVAYSLAATQ